MKKRWKSYAIVAGIIVVGIVMVGLGEAKNFDLGWEITEDGNGLFI